MTFVTRSDNETRAIGKKIATKFKGGDIVCLYGDLGAGKTTLTKGMAERLGVREEITSPTFTLMNVYKTATASVKKQISKNSSKAVPNNEILKMVHIDTYRLQNEKELLAIGVEDYLGHSDTITIIEWPEKIECLLMSKFKNSKIIKIKINSSIKDERTIEALL